MTWAVLPLAAAVKRGRLRTVDHWGFLLALAVLGVPLVAWVVGYVTADWILAGDEALIAIRAHDAWTGHWPLVGMRSTSTETSPDIMAFHPGPMQFYLLGLPYLLSGWHEVGVLIGGALIVFGFVGVCVWSGYRAAGTAGLLTMSIAVVLLYGLFDSVLVLPWNPWPPVLGLLSCLALAWRMMLGHRGLWPLFVVCASFVAQGHLGLAPIAVFLGLVLATQSVLRWRRSAQPRIRRRELRWTLGVALVCWAGPLLHSVRYPPSNFSEILALARADQGTTGAGKDALVHLSSMLFPWWRLERDRGNVTIAGLVLVFAAVGILVASWWERRRGREPEPTERAAYVGVGLGLLAVAATGWSGVSTGGGIRILFIDYLMAAPVFLTVTVGLWTVTRVSGAIRWLGGRGRQVMGVLGVCTAVILAVTGANSYQRESVERGYAQDHAQARLVTSTLLPLLAEPPFADLPVVIEAGGFTAWGGILPAVAARLVADGRAVHFSTPWPRPADDDFRRPERINGEFARVRIEQYESRAQVPGLDAEAVREFTVDFLSQPQGVIRLRILLDEQ